jgi:hypothetical protein
MGLGESRKELQVISEEVSRRSAGRVENPLVVGLLGLVSGSLVWVVAMFVWEPLVGLKWEFKLAGWELSLNQFTLAPGLIFGAVVGGFLCLRDLIRPWQLLAYLAAATVSNFIATNFAVGMADSMNSAAALGMAAGLLGAACLTALSLLLFPFVRRSLPCLLMVGAGMLLGGLLKPALEDSGEYVPGLLLLYAVWQAGYAGALGTALPKRRP